MAAGKYNFTIDQGSDFLTFFTLKTTTNGVTTNRDLAGYTARASMRPTPESLTAYNFVVGITTPTTNGKITMSLASGVSKDIPAGIYLYDLELTSGAGSVERVIQGQITLTREVTR
jgi:hypothetical protein